MHTPPRAPLDEWLARYVQPVALPIALAVAAGVLLLAAWRAPQWSALTDFLRGYLGALAP